MKNNIVTLVQWVKLDDKYYKPSKEDFLNATFYGLSPLLTIFEEGIECIINSRKFVFYFGDRNLNISNTSFVYHKIILNDSEIQFIKLKFGL